MNDSRTVGISLLEAITARARKAAGAERDCAQVVNMLGSALSGVAHLPGLPAEALQECRAALLDAVACQLAVVENLNDGAAAQEHALCLLSSAYTAAAEEAH